MADFDEDWFQQIIKINIPLGSVVRVEGKVTVSGSLDDGVTSDTKLPSPPQFSTTELNIKAYPATKNGPAVPKDQRILAVFASLDVFPFDELVDLKPYRKVGVSPVEMKLSFPGHGKHTDYHIYAGTKSFIDESTGNFHGPFGFSFDGRSEPGGDAEASAKRQAVVQNGRYFNNDPFFPDYYDWTTILYPPELVSNPETKTKWEYTVKKYNTTMELYPNKADGTPATFKIIDQGSGNDAKPVTKTIKA